MKKSVLLVVFFIISSVFSQEERKTLFGTVYDLSGVLENAHIVNFSNSTATFTNEKGEYRIFAKPTDSIRYTSIGYKTIFKRLTKEDFNTYRKTTLEKQEYELDEILVRNNDLSGTLNKDLKKIKPDVKQEALTKSTDFTKVSFKTTATNDYVDRRVRPTVVRTDPTKDFEGLRFSDVGAFKNSKELWKLRKELAFKETMPANLLNELGEKFFFVELKIPVDRYYHFLEYCNPLHIEEHYQNRQVLKVINILRKEHMSYLKIIEKE